MAERLGEPPPAEPWLREASAVATRLGVDPARGLEPSEASRRLQAYGANSLDARPPEPLWHRVLRQFADPFVYLLLGAMAVSLAAWLAEGAAGFPLDTLVIGAIVALNGGIGLVQERRAEAAVAALATLTATTSTVLRAGRLTSIPASELVPGDVLSLAEGDAVGADARLLTATDLRVQEASLTGESWSVAKDAAALGQDVGVADRVNMVYRGTGVASGVGRAIVTATGMATEIGSIARLLDETAREPSPLEREVGHISKALGIAVCAVAAVVMGALFVLNPVASVSEAVAILLVGVSLAVAAVPEGMPAIMSVVLAIGVRELAAHNAIMKRLSSVETLGSASVICSDKTGTLTRSEMTLRVIVTASGEVELTGTGYDPNGSVAGTPSPGALGEATAVLSGGAIANNAQLNQDESGWSVTGDPTEAAFLVALRKVPGASAGVRGHRRLGEVPFTSARKLMSVAAHDAAAADVRLFTKGAPDVLLGRCASELVGGGAVPLDPARRGAIEEAVERLGAQGYRTLGVAYTDLGAAADWRDGVDEEAEADLTFAGVVGIFDPPRPEAGAAIAEARRAGIQVIMITGDHPTTAARVASDLGILGPGARVLTGAELDTLSPEELPAAVGDVSVFARVGPEHKLRIVDALQSRGGVVAMTGDGVNDAAALKSADIGIAMGVTGTEVTKEAGTMILGDDNFATIIAAVRQGRGILDNIKKFLRYLLSSNMGEVTAVFFGIVLAVPLGLTDASSPGVLVAPLLATQILWINLVTDSGPALAMGLDPIDRDVMRRPPRDPGARILDRAMWTRVVGVGLVMGAATLATFAAFLPGGALHGGDSLETARTAAFTTLVFAQLFNAFSSRSETRSAFARLFDNPWLWASVVAAVLLQVAVVEWAPLQAAFGTTSLDAPHWATCVALASVPLWAVELIKLIGWLRRGEPAGR